MRIAILLATAASVCALDLGMTRSPHDDYRSWSSDDDLDRLSLDGSRTSWRLGFSTLPTKTELSSLGSSMEVEWGNTSRGSFGMWHNWDVTSSTSFSLGTCLTFGKYDDLTCQGLSFSDTIGFFGLQLEPGLSINLARSLSIELGVPLGFGRANHSADVSGGYAKYGLLARPVVTLNQFQISAEIGHLAQLTTLDDTRWMTSGLTYGLGLGLTF